MSPSRLTAQLRAAAAATAGVTNALVPPDDTVAAPDESSLLN
jgi:hypothetical protein